MKIWFVFIILFFARLEAGAAVTSIYNCGAVEVDTIKQEVMNFACTIGTDDAGIFTIHISPSQARMRLDGTGNIQTADQPGMKSALKAAAAQAEANIVQIRSAETTRKTNVEKINVPILLSDVK